MYNSRTSCYIGMKLGSVNKTDKRNKLTSYKLDDDLMSLSSCDDYCRFSKFKPMWSNFETGSVKSVKSVNLQICKTYIFINSNLPSYKNCKQNEEISNTALTILLWVKALLLLIKRWFFAKKIRRTFVPNGTLSETI